MDYASVQRDVMTGDLVKDWWAKLIIGLILIVWGFLAFISPELSLLTVIVIFGMMCLVRGYSDDRIRPFGLANGQEQVDDGH